MSRNKKIIILITILLIILLNIIGILIFKYSKNDAIVIGENNENQMQANIIKDENSAENTQTNNIEKNNNIEDNKVLQNQIIEENKKKETTSKVQEQNAEISKKENGKINENNKQKTDNKKNEKDNKTTLKNKVSDKSDNKKEVPVTNKETKKHKHIGIGTSGKWVTSVKEIEKEWDKLSAYYEELLDKEKITWDEYCSKCPNGYKNVHKCESILSGEQCEYITWDWRYSNP